MKQNKSIFLIVLLCAILGLSPKAMASNEAIQYQRIPFSLWDVRLLDSPFKHAMELDKKWLLKIDADKLLSGYRTEAGLDPKASKYGGWESGGLSGHSLGHYLSALSMMYASTGDTDLYRKIEYVLNELDICQQKNNGMLAGFPNAKKLFSEIEKGKIYSQGFDLNGYWVPIYNLHKLFAGLIDVCNYTKDKKALKILSRLSSWWVSVLANLNDQQLQKLLICEPGGITEAMAQVSVLTGDKTYLQYAERMNDQSLIVPLLHEKDSLCGMHANTQIPKIIGIIQQYELTGKDDYIKIADFFWNTVVKHHTYAIGGNSESEHFGRPDNLSHNITAMTAENCNTYNMLKLTKKLYMLDASVPKVEYSERAIFNQIIGSQHPISGMVRYFSPLAKGNSTKGFSDPENSFWCCVGSGWENHARYGEQIYFQDRNENLYINLYIPSTLQWKSKNTSITQQSNFLQSGKIEITIAPKSQQSFSLYLRIPQWTNDYRLTINGKHCESKIKEGYIKINRKWNAGDKIELDLQLSIYSEPIAGDSSMRAFLYGPFVLNGVIPSDTLINALVCDKGNFEKLITYNGNGLFTAQIASGNQIIMKPYYQSYNEIGAIYFKCLSSKQWKEEQSILRNNQMTKLELEKKMIDLINLGEMQPERDHNFQGTETEVGTINEKKYRKATNKGYFSFDMKVNSTIPMTLLCTYWGNLPHGHTFDIFIDNFKLATETVHYKGNLFYEKKYNIPQKITQNKTTVTVSFRPIKEGFIAGPVFQCAMVMN